jgi:hypothetical protein
MRAQARSAKADGFQVVRNRPATVAGRRYLKTLSHGPRKTGGLQG